jgi:hypothetical protein
MDIYRALNADVPQLLFTVLHQAGPTISDEDFTRTVTALHLDIRKQAREVGEELQQWLQRQAQQEAEESARKLQRLGLLAETANVETVRQAIERDFRRFAGRVGSESVLGMQGSGEEVFSETLPLDADLQSAWPMVVNIWRHWDLNPARGLCTRHGCSFAVRCIMM